MDDTYPQPISDPAASGLPEYADDDSTAYDDVQSPGVADGRDPAAHTSLRRSGSVIYVYFGRTPAPMR